MSIKVNQHPEVKARLDAYPPLAQGKILELRALILEAASEIDQLTTLEETLKWGEPSYLTKNGSTLRMDWKSKTPNQYAIYFKCTSRLVETFKIVFVKNFVFEGNRAIIFQMDDQIPVNELKECIKATLTYHKVKQLPTLGIYK
jgi:hypothetical protein